MPAELKNSKQAGGAETSEATRRVVGNEVGAIWDHQ